MSRMNIRKMTFVLNDFSIEEMDKYRDSVIDFTYYGTREISSGAIQKFEDEVMTALTVQDEDFEPVFTMDDKDLIQDRIGAETYDMLLNEELDFIMLIGE